MVGSKEEPTTLDLNVQQVRGRIDGISTAKLMNNGTNKVERDKATWLNSRRMKRRNTCLEEFVTNISMTNE